MRTVNIAELKNRLSTYLTYAKAGEEVVIRDRNRPVAKLVPYVAVDATDEELQLVAEGHLRLPEKLMDMEAFLKMPKAELKGGGSIVQTLLDEREEGW